MTTVVSPPPRAVDVGSATRGLLKPLGLVAFVGALGYFVLGPLVKLQGKAFADGAAGYRTAFTSTDRRSVVLAHAKRPTASDAPSRWGWASLAVVAPVGASVVLMG